MRMSVEPAVSAFALRRHLLILVVAAVVPVLVFATIMVVVFGRGERASTERGLRDTTRALTLAVDREIETSIKALEALAASLHLDRDDYNAFERHAGRSPGGARSSSPTRAAKSSCAARAWAPPARAPRSRADRTSAR